MWNTSLVEIVDPVKTWQFPADYSSGANAITKELSFKSCQVGRFKTKGDKPYTFTVLNVHPSPYLVGPAYTRGESDLKILITHIYQMTFVAMKMKSLIEGSRPVHGAGNIRDTYIVCGDWNLNKFLQNGFSNVDPGLIKKL